ncbi:MAG: hypothetical protein ACYS7Y_11555 [Planctomycetota bacterium]|jgi:hypothetical protein
MNIKIKRILLDVDDVLNQFTMFSLKLAGCDVDPMDNSQFPTEVGYDVTAACNLLHPSFRRWTPVDYWAMMPKSAWSHTPKSPECDWIIDTCADLVGEENVFLCTSATNNPECLAGKLMWIQRELPKWLHRQYCITPNKYLLAAPDAILIDDSLKNCEQFQENTGRVFLVPKPWNPDYPRDTRKSLEEIFVIISEMVTRKALIPTIPN